MILSLKFFHDNPGIELKIPFEEEVIDFVKKTNMISLKNANSKSKDKVDMLMITRAFDLLFNFKHLKKYFKEPQTFMQLKVLTYNNLSCIYKQQGKYSLALKAITNALAIEEKLLDKNKSLLVNVVETMLNRSAILSQMKRHGKAVETLKEALGYVKDIKKGIPIDAAESKDEKVRANAKQLVHLQVYAYYNLGVQYEFLKHRKETLDSYKKA